MSVFDVFYRFYPYKLFLGKEGRDAVESVLKTFAILGNSQDRKEFSGKILGIDKKGISSTITLHREGEKTTLDVSKSIEIVFCIKRRKTIDFHSSKCSSGSIRFRRRIERRECGIRGNELPEQPHIRFDDFSFGD